jgi:hypothetical protein
MFCGGNENAFFLQAGGIANARYVAANGFNFKVIQVTAAEDNAGSRGRGQDSEGHISPAMEPYALAFHQSPNCLFKWQVIPTKQITPAAALAYVVFLQQIVSGSELLLFHRIDLGYGGIKQSVGRMDVVGDIQNDLLRNGFAIPLDERHARRVDSLDYFPIAIN